MCRRAAVSVVLALAAGCAHGRPGSELASVAAWAVPGEVAPGEGARIVLEIRLASGAHLSEDAPLSVEIEARNLAVARRVLGWADASVVDGTTRLEVSARAVASGSALAEAKLVYYVCTDEQCTRQSATARVPLVVR